MRRSHRPGRIDRPGNLPEELNSFVGRAEELDRLDSRLTASRLVTVVGVGGVGKSRLALSAARRAREAFPDGAWLVELATVRDPDLVTYALVEALDLTDHTARSPLSVLTEQLADRELLLVVDGFEHLVDAIAPVVRELLRRCPGVRVLAAGRRPLGVEGEWVHGLAPLPEADAATLFAERAACGPAGFTLGRTCLPEVLELCRRLDGIPLAVELAAGRLGALSPAQLLARLDDRFRLLTGGGQRAARHETLRTAIGWSHELCTPPQRLLWARLSVFTGPFDLEAAEYVCAGQGLPAAEVLDTVDELIAQSVVLREDSPEGARYRMLATVREYGDGWLRAAGDAERLRRRHRDWYLGLAVWCELDWFSPRQAEIASRVESELPNLRAALEYCLNEPDETHQGQLLAGTLWFYWVGCGHLSEGRYWLDRGTELDGEHEDSRLKALWVLGYVAALQGDTIGSLGALQTCRDEAEHTGSPLAVAYAVHRLGCLALVDDDMPRAERLLREAQLRYGELGELNSNVLMGRVELAMSLVFQDRAEEALRLCREVDEICEQHGERWTRAYALYVLGYAAWTRGDFRRARQLAEECVTIDHTFRDLVGLVLAVELLALITASEGDPAEAALLQGAADPLWDSVGLPLFGSDHFRAPRSHCVRRTAELLGAERFEQCVRKGRTLGLEATVERALAGSGTDSAVLPAPRPARTRPTPDARKPAGSPTGNGGEQAGS
ncbi:putative HTH-type transcriptional regulator [Streptomyces sp. YIM 130001]|uniref:ATP-binding protein n=1 Tax=Streptomyces sp. YIM 130001 TaxID=2259644 RepID=UPI000E6504DD|nr:tetratricopeptide repeat protein [Streptomyces sp. YIM 130001]RII19466.1 putative HTH-type transcriptional regulator [Streptomyces sp. YIM 130001]